jgi:hypothetical protein
MHHRWHTDLAKQYLRAEVHTRSEQYPDPKDYAVLEYDQPQSPRKLDYHQGLNKHDHLKRERQQGYHELEV